jgi:hypothetical protein
MPEFIAEVLVTKRFKYRICADNEHDAADLAGAIPLPDEPDFEDESLVSVTLAEEMAA